jgi:phosphodiesterase/alkaline phosphatase D-like protein
MCTWRWCWIALLAWTLAAGSAGADVVAIKRSAGLSIDVGLDSTFKTAIAGGTIVVYTDASTGQDVVDDTYFYPSGNGQYQNYGASPSIGGSAATTVMMKFNVAALPDFTGGRVLKAQLRMYYGSGNSGLQSTGAVTSFDWAEGNKIGTYPGLAPAAPGASLAHPAGLNTSSYQDINGGTAGPLQSWAFNGYFNPAKDGGAVVVAPTFTKYTANLPDGSNPSSDGFVVMDVTSIVQAWGDGEPNYGTYTTHTACNYVVHFSETVIGPDFQPLLAIEYERNGPPNAVTNLAAADVDWYQLRLTWTAPSDLPPGPVASYDFRYSTSLIDDGNFAAATPLPNVPAAAAPGTAQDLLVTGLNPSTQYSFAMRSRDVAGVLSPLSNVVSVTTIDMDTTPPADVADLAAVDIRPNHIVLAWTAPGDDGNTDTAAGYELRYSTAPIDPGNFAASTLIETAAPQPAGSAETVTLHGLAPATTYYFAIRSRDERPNWSGLSNVAVATTMAEDLTPPECVSDLRVVSAHIRTAVVLWTAPADVGPAGCAFYDLRYSTVPIDEGNWAGAVQVDGEPAPATPGTSQRITVLGLSADTQYYFAIKTGDWAEPSNVSALSNVAAGRTMPPVSPVVVRNPWIVNDRVADCRTLATMGATFGNDYSPSGVTAPADNQAKAINLYNNVKRRLYHWANMPPDAADPIENLNVFGWALCGTHAAIDTQLAQEVGLNARKIAVPGHNFYEVEYDGAWHAMDTMTTMYVYNRSTPRKIASCQEIKNDNSLMLNAIAEGRACPGFLLCGDTPEWFADAINSYSAGGAGTSSSHSMDMDLAMGQSLRRTWEAWINQRPPAGEPPFHHEAQHDWKDYVNLPYWEPYTLDTAENAAIGIAKSVTYRRWANGTSELRPDFRSAGHQASLVSSANIATFHEDGMSPDLHVATPGTPAEVVFHIQMPFYITDASISGDFYRKTTADTVRIFYSVNGTTWTQAWEPPALGDTHLANLNIGTYVRGRYDYYIKIQLQASTSGTDAGLSDLVIATSFEHNKGAMAYLDKGVNHITVTCDNPQDLASGASFRVVYKWKEYDGSDWTVDRIQEQFITGSPTTFTINADGAKVPRTEYILMEVSEPPMPDSSAPAPVTDLASIGVDSTRVTLTWTASGDDWDQGTASGYDLRYSTSPITADNFAAAAAVANPPAPRQAGSAETFTVTALTPSTAYWFALKVRDEGGNNSDLSNVVQATTLPPDVTPPAAITDLAAQPGTQSGSVQLAWTAPGDDGSTGTATAYEVRYQPQAAGPITGANWAGATLVSGVAAPKPAGSAEQLTVAGLTWGASYYFAIRAGDEVPNTSEVSNCPLGQAASLGEVVLQNGRNGYVGCRDNYMYAGNVTRNYGTSSLMRVTGYATLGAEMQRALVRFDVSSIPAGTPITRATLWLYSNNPPQVKGSTGFYGAYRLTKDWSETTSCWSVPWTIPGGDFDAAADALAPKQASSAAPCWYAFEVTDRVQAWINGAANYGWLIKCTDENLSNQDEFASSDSSELDYRPKLVISDLAAQDTIAPDAVTDLAGSDHGDGTIHLTWTATGDDGTTGTAWRYNLRYTTFAQGPISAANWDSALPVAGLALPQPAGSAESCIISGLLSRQGYHFALKVEDEIGNTSGLSNVASVWLEPGPRTVVLGPSKDSGLYGLVASGNSNRGAGGRFDLRADDPVNVNSALMQFDLTDVLAAGERIESARLDLFSVRLEAALAWDLQIRAYPLLAHWVEGMGTTDGVAGSTDYPWGPVSIGDAVYSYRQVTAAAPDAGFGGYEVATAGVPWAVPGARGAGGDISDEAILDLRISGTGYGVGQKVLSASFTEVGVNVLNGWATGTRANHGFSLFPLNGGTGYLGIGTREYPDTGCRPVLTLMIVPALVGDSNIDGRVDVSDLLMLAGSWGKTLGEAGFNPACDFNGDNGVDVVDLLMLAENWGR